MVLLASVSIIQSLLAVLTAICTVSFAYEIVEIFGIYIEFQVINVQLTSPIRDPHNENKY